jgi:hypothetical protein
MSGSEKNRRFSVTFDERATAKLERLAGDDAEKKAEFIRQGVALEEIRRQTVREGGNIFIRRSDGSIAEIVRDEKRV